MDGTYLNDWSALHKPVVRHSWSNSLKISLILVFSFVGIKQHVNINFSFKIWKTATETYAILATVYGSYAQYCSLPMTGKIHSGAWWSWTWSKAQSAMKCSKASAAVFVFSSSLLLCSLAGSHELIPKEDHPMTLILTKYQLQINRTIQQIVIWYNYLWKTMERGWSASSLFHPISQMKRAYSHSS